MGEYSKTFVQGLEWMWGEGFMSPGGVEEVEAILQDVDLTGKRVLDIGCGIGGIDLLLVQKFGASHVTGIDVEAPLVTQANQNIARAGLQDQVSAYLVDAGPLPFPTDSFDVVFSKDSIIHIPDKKGIYAEMFRVLRSGGQVAFSDWFFSNAPKTPEFAEWYEVFGLTVEMGVIEDAATLLESVGFVDVTCNDRNAWYAKNIEEELAAIEGENYPKLEAAIGAEAAAQRVKSSRLKKVVVDKGQLRPGHVRGRKG